MRDDNKIVLLKSGNRIVVDPTTERVAEELEHLLTYEVRDLSPNARRKGSVEMVEYQLFTYDHRERLATSFGMHKRVSRTLQKLGLSVEIKDVQPHPNPQVYEPWWDRLFDPSNGIELRHGQEEFLVKMMSNPCGRFDCPPGFGKSWIIGIIGMLLPEARIDVVSRRVPVLRDRIYPDLAQTLPSVGIVGGGKSIKNRRVMCYTAGSLHHADGQADVVIGDECHELAADTAAEKMSRYQRARCYGLSATHDMRLDNKDMRVEAMFGPLLYSMPYDEARRHGMVVPIKVIWRDVIMNYNPCGDAADMVDRKRFGVWHNDVRNDLVAQDARLYDDDTQVLITCETIGHMCRLKRLLPEYTMVYAEDGMSPNDRRRYIRQKLIDHDEPYMTYERRQRLTRDFENGTLKKAICNTVWNVGVNFRQLGVLIRADAGGSPINDVQIPGRASRVTEGKDFSIVHDYRDQFDKGFRRKAKQRERMYDKQGWRQEFPSPRSRKPVRAQTHFNFAFDD